MAAQTITTADKVTGDLFRYTEYNEIKTVVNDHASLLDQDNPLNKPYHGIYAAGALSFNSTSHVLTVAAGTNSYYYLGELYSTTAAITCDLDSTAVRDNSSNTFADNVLYYFYFKDATGTLYWSDAFWNLLTMVPVATVFWNGTSGAIATEKHTYNRDLRWHMWAHLTIGTQYGTGSSLTYPNAANDASLQIETGTYYDEDLTLVTGQCTTMRGWYKASANVYTFADYALPYLGASGDPYWLDTDDYTLKSVADAKYVNYWVYASGDIDRPIYVIPTHAADTYNTVALARAEAPPNLASFNMNAEIKLIYRFLYKGDGEFQEYTDYRLSQPLPSGGVPTPSAGSVSFTPSGTIAATTVQTAIEELDTDNRLKRLIQIKVFSDAQSVATGDGKLIMCIPSELNNYNLTGVAAFCTTVSSSGTPTVMIRNVTDTQDMLSTAITIDANEYTSYSAAAAAVIDTSYDDVVTGDLIAVDIDVAGTGTKGLGVILTFEPQ